MAEGAVKRELTPYEKQLADENAERIGEIELARMYYAGDQWEGENEDAYTELQRADQTATPGRLPEHLKKVAYSTQIQECVDYIAAQLAEGFQVTAQDSTVQNVIDKALSSSPDLASDDDEDDLNVTNVFRDALVAADIAVRVRWDGEEQTPWLEFWESEAVDFQFAPGNRFKLEKVWLTETIWKEDGDDWVEVVQIKEWYLDTEGDCWVNTWHDDELVSGEPEGLRFIPWRMWRGQKKKIRTTRGESLITTRIRRLADRYDAVEQLSFVIARYNSHGNLAVIGDAALLQNSGDSRLHKDVADVLTLPGGTTLANIQLPTDPKMIEHQRDVCLDALFSAFGITRLDSDTVQGLGALSGYALEILNRKSDGTFGQIGKQLARDIRSTLNLVLDVYAVKIQEPSDDEELADLELVDPAEEPDDGVDVDAAFPNRAMKIEMGSGYIVDEVMLRDDFTSKLVSRRHVLKKRGMTDPEIDEMEQQLEDEKGEFGEVQLSPTARTAAATAVKAGSTLSAAKPTQAKAGV